MIDEKKTDAEFIAECEEHNQEMLDRWFCGSGYEKFLKSDVGLDFAITRAEFAEVIERLKRAKGQIDSRDERIRYLTTEYRAQWEDLLSTEHKHYAELKSLLRWCFDSLCGIEPVGAFGKIQTAWDCVDGPEKQRIEEILKENE